MKTNLILTTIALLFISLTSYSQGNGGQYFENTRSKLYQVNCSTDSVILVNKQSCQVEYKISVKGNSGGWQAQSNITVNGNDSLVLTYLGYSKLKVKPLNNCGNPSGGDMGWIELDYCTSSTPLANYIQEFNILDGYLIWNAENNVELYYSNNSFGFNKVQELPSQGKLKLTNNGYYYIICNGQQSSIKMINSITNNLNKNNTCYDLSGRKVNCDVKNRVIIKNGVKTFNLK